MTPARYVLNVNDGVDTLHRNPREECNTDDAKGVEVIDPRSAVALMSKGTVALCQHCMVDRPTLDVQNHLGDG
jgi:hypothetical protein